MPRTILILEDDPRRGARLRTALQCIDPAQTVITWPDAHQMIRDLPLHLPDTALISLDHDLYPSRPGAADPGDGLDVARHLATYTPTCPVVIHSTNTERARMMRGELEFAGWQCIRVAPLGDDWVEADWVLVVRDLLRRPLR